VNGFFGNRAVAIATVAAALIGLLSLLLAVQQAFFKGDPKPHSTTTNPSPDGPTTANTSTSTEDPPPAKDPGVQWAATVRLRRGGVDLDGASYVKGDAGADLRKDEYTEIAPGPGASLIEWTEPGEPGYQDCRQQVEPGSDLPLFEVPPASWFCALTGDGRVAAVHYLGIGDGGQFGFAITVWRR
jgi:hypothetical protein